MLLEFSCSNHRSIRDMVCLSMLGGADDRFLEQTREFGGDRVLKSAVIYGANGSGKSNFLQAISFVRTLVVHSAGFQPGQVIPQSPFRSEEPDQESVYRIQFVVEEIRYFYRFSLRDGAVGEEYLYYFPNGKQTKIFERQGEVFTAGRSFRGKFETCREVLRSNRLMLSCAANFSTVMETEAAFRFFRDELVICPSSSWEWLQRSLQRMAGEEGLRSAMIALLQQLGTGIRDISISARETHPWQKDIPAVFRSAGAGQGMVEEMRAAVVYEHFRVDLMTEESTGIRRILALLCPLLEVMAQGKVLICDGLESGLHESVTENLVRLFSETESEQFSQLIFTTQDTNLLSPELFRRDQIWFTELKQDRSTDLYSLSEVRNVRKEENFEKAYLRGKYGATPKISPEFSQIVPEM